MPIIKINDREFDRDSLSAEAKNSLKMLQLAEKEIHRLEQKLVITKTARNAYANALKSALPTPLEQVQAQGETLKLN